MPSPPGARRPSVTQGAQGARGDASRASAILKVMPPAAPTFVVIDTETTGLDPAQDRLIDIGAVRLDRRLQIVDRFQTLVTPGVPLPLAVTRLVGLSEADLLGAPAFAEAYQDLRAFVADATLVAHNAAFDREHLAAGARRAGLPQLTNAWLDTLQAALLLYPELDRHALPLLAAEFGLAGPLHRALPDAETAAALLARLAARASGLAAQERSLLQAAAWAPLAPLLACGAAPDEAPPPLVADEPRSGGPAQLTILPVARGGWRRELGVAGEDDAEAQQAAPGGDVAAEATPSASPDEPGVASDGVLAARLPGFRHRAGQVQLADAAAATFRSGGVGLFEAGTGMGKSLAYLLPAAFFSAAAGRRVVVSTKTKALQRQLAAHELPLVQEALPPGWRWALLMGRENYICRRRLDEAAATGAEAPPEADRALALAYLMGRARRGDVDLSALPYRATLELPALAGLARELRSSRATCLGRYCPVRRGCHWRLARAKAEAAHLVCVNHALLLTGRETLPPFEDVVIDEAHLLYHEATEAFSRQVDARALDLMLADLRGHRRQRPLATRLRAAARGVDAADAKALLAAADTCERAAATLPDLVRAAGEGLGALATASQAGDQGERRPFGQDYDRSVWLTPGLRELPAWDAFATAAGLLAEGLLTLAAAADAAAEVLPDEHRDHAEVATLGDEAAATAALLGELPDGGDDASVVWGEVEAAGRSVMPSLFPLRWSLTATPLTPGPQVRTALWDTLRSAVLTSATLTVAGSFSYFRDMTGLDGDVDVAERVFASPFDYERQAVLVLEHDPDGAWLPDDLPERQAERLKGLAEATGGRTLALFTNTRDMHRVARAVGDHLEDDGVLVLAQGLHGSASALADEFRAHPETILLGVDTLWTGQDFPGDALTCLVIAKLPFPRQDPLFSARRSACEQAGERWFDRFYLPEAVLKFRQGVGRLIRTETDTGVIVVLDHRLTQKAYRRDFLASLPPMPVIEASPADMAGTVRACLGRLGCAPPG
jgi:ATP-dependent DNA helicase DinG